MAEGAGDFAQLTAAPSDDNVVADLLSLSETVAPLQESTDAAAAAAATNMEGDDDATKAVGGEPRPSTASSQTPSDKSADDGEGEGEAEGDGDNEEPDGKLTQKAIDFIKAQEDKEAKIIIISEVDSSLSEGFVVEGWVSGKDKSAPEEEDKKSEKEDSGDEAKSEENGEKKPKPESLQIIPVKSDGGGGGGENESEPGDKAAVVAASAPAPDISAAVTGEVEQQAEKPAADGETPPANDADAVTSNGKEEPVLTVEKVEQKPKVVDFYLTDNTGSIRVIAPTEELAAKFEPQVMDGQKISLTNVTVKMPTEEERAADPAASGPLAILDYNAYYIYLQEDTKIEEEEDESMQKRLRKCLKNAKDLTEEEVILQFRLFKAIRGMGTCLCGKLMGQKFSLNGRDPEHKMRSAIVCKECLGLFLHNPEKNSLVAKLDKGNNVYSRLLKKLRALLKNEKGLDDIAVLTSFELDYVDEDEDEMSQCMCCNYDVQYRHFMRCSKKEQLKDNVEEILLCRKCIEKWENAMLDKNEFTFLRFFSTFFVNGIPAEVDKIKPKKSQVRFVLKGKHSRDISEFLETFLDEYDLPIDRSITETNKVHIECTYDPKWQAPKRYTSYTVYLQAEVSRVSGKDVPKAKFFLVKYNKKKAVGDYESDSYESSDSDLERPPKKKRKRSKFIDDEEPYNSSDSEFDPYSNADDSDDSDEGGKLSYQSNETSSDDEESSD